MDHSYSASKRTVGAPKRSVLRSISREAHFTVAQNLSTSNQLLCLQVPWSQSLAQVNWATPVVAVTLPIYYVQRACVIALASCESFRGVDATELVYNLLIELANP